MKTILFQLSLIGAAFLACASPIAFDPNTLVQRNPLASASSIGTNIPSHIEWAVDVELSSSPGLTRRGFHPSRLEPSHVSTAAVPITLPINPSAVPEMHYNYDTPLKFMHSLELRRTDARRERIEIWKSKGVEDLKVMVDSLKEFDFPLWLIDECRDKIKDELQLADLFQHQEVGETYYLRTIEKHAQDVGVIGERFAREHPPSPPPFDEYYSSECESEGPENQIHCVHGHPLRSPSPKGNPNTSPHVINPKVNERHIQARRKRIDEWAASGIEPLKKKVAMLPMLNFPSWLVYGEYEVEILHTSALIEEFLDEEKDKGYRDKIQSHNDAMDKFYHTFYKELNAGFYDRHLPELLPQIKKDGQWRKLVQDLADEVKNLKTDNHLRRLHAQIDAGLNMCTEMLGSRTRRDTEDRRRQLKEFEEFLELTWAKHEP